MTLFRVLMLTVGHDNTPKCMCMLCMTLFRVLMLTVGHDSLMCVCVCVCVSIKRDATNVPIKGFFWYHALALTIGFVCVRMCMCVVYDTVLHSNAYSGS